MLEKAILRRVAVKAKAKVISMIIIGGSVVLDYAA